MMTIQNGIQVADGVVKTPQTWIGLSTDKKPENPANGEYNTGDPVHYPTEDDPVYVSNIDGNVWSPEEIPRYWDKEGD